MFIRFHSAFDHDQDGIIGNETGPDKTINSDGIRESGSLLKTIALLPYFKQLGINTLHLLPVTAIGQDGRKGDLGSPYAIKNHFEIDNTIADPLLPFSAEEQLCALVQAAHSLNMRVVFEFIFRTSAIDADWVSDHPEWYYWIDENANIKQPDFSHEALKIIEKIPKGEGEFVEPSHSYQNMFHSTPHRSSIKKKRQKYIGESQGQRVKICSAFADWPPNDPQPPWTDVTYLKFYNSPPEKNFNYIAYNTIRYYDQTLAAKSNENQPLWEELLNIIPYYQDRYGIDGVMIDMGHALPLKFKELMIRRALEKDPSFAFWDEKFEADESTLKSGYHAIIGNLWYFAAKKNGLKKVLNKYDAFSGTSFFGTPETHNSPRFGYRNPSKKRNAFLLLNLLPGSVPFVHQGFELNEWVPVNTGLNISRQLENRLANKPLPLFNKSCMHWTSTTNMSDFFQWMSDFVREYPDLFNEHFPLENIETNNAKVLCVAKKIPGYKFLFVFNTNYRNTESYTAKVNSVSTRSWTNFVTGNTTQFKSSTKHEITRGDHQIFFQTS